jgi:hypothetical protein
VAHQRKILITHSFQRDNQTDKNKTTIAMDKAMNTEQLHTAAWNVRELPAKNVVWKKNFYEHTQMWPLYLKQKKNWNVQKIYITGHITVEHPTKRKCLQDQ